MQANVEWKDFQWRPQVVACGDTTWALWANRSASSCHSGQDQCGPGAPFVRRLFKGAEWKP